MPTLYYKNNNAWEQLNLLTNLSGSDLQNLRKEMGLGDTLGPLPIENGGTSYNQIPDNSQLRSYLQQQSSELTGNEPIFANNLLMAINLLNGEYYPLGSLLVSGNVVETITGDDLHNILSINKSPIMILADEISGIIINDDGVTLTKPGIYSIECVTSASMKASGYAWGASWNGSAKWTIAGTNIKDNETDTAFTSKDIASASFSGSFEDSSSKNIDRTETLLLKKDGGTDSVLTLSTNNKLTVNASTASGPYAELSVNNSIVIHYYSGIGRG